MRKVFIAFLLFLLFLIGFVVFFNSNSYNKGKAKSNMKIILPFEECSSIPKKYTCEGQNINPKIVIETNETGYFAVVVHDPDAPIGDFIHWVAYNIKTKTIPENSSRKGLYNEALNDFGYVGYGGPCPPSGEKHRYYFEVYLLKKKLPKIENAKEAIELIKENAVSKAVYCGYFKR